MPEEVVFYVTKYGYLAIFILVFLQEIGMPNPFPNELLLIFSGYLTFKGVLFLPFVIITALSADFIGTNILYFLFYNAGAFIMKKKPGWLPLSSAIMNRLSIKISKGGVLSIYIFRLTPFTRGYTSVITGLLQVKPKVFLPIAFFSGLTWATVYVVIGNLIGPSWNLFTQNIDCFGNYMLTVLVLIICTVLLMYGFRKKRKNKVNAVINNS
jgi:membrane protein DedA with SNARE-associated domain